MIIAIPCALIVRPTAEGVYIGYTSHAHKWYLLLLIVGSNYNLYSIFSTFLLLYRSAICEPQLLIISQIYYVLSLININSMFIQVH